MVKQKTRDMQREAEAKQRWEQRGSFLDIEPEFSCPYKACSLLPG